MFAYVALMHMLSLAVLPSRRRLGGSKIDLIFHAPDPSTFVVEAVSS